MPVRDADADASIGPDGVVATVLAIGKPGNSQTDQCFLVPPTGVEPATYGTGNRRCSEYEVEIREYAL